MLWHQQHQREVQNSAPVPGSYTPEPDEVAVLRMNSEIDFKAIIFLRHKSKVLLYTNTKPSLTFRTSSTIMNINRESTLFWLLVSTSQCLLCTGAARRCQACAAEAARMPFQGYKPNPVKFRSSQNIHRAARKGSWRCWTRSVSSSSTCGAQAQGVVPHKEAENNPI